MGSATVTISVPASGGATALRRGPAYVSGASQSISISSYAVVSNVIAGSPSATANQDLTSSSPGCSGTGPIVCSITIPAPIGQVAFSVTVYAGLGQSGAVLSALPQTAATEFTVAEGAKNVVLPLILGGVPKTIVVTPYAGAVTGGFSTTVPLAVVASDAAGNVIVGAGDYANPIALTNTDGSGSTALSTATVSGPSSTVSLAYNGGAFTSPLTIGATATGATATPGQIQLVLGALNVACSSGCSSLSNGNTPYSETISEGGYGNGAFTLSGSGSSCTFDPPSSVAAANGSATVNIYPDPAGGTCTLGVTSSDSKNATATAAFVAAANPTVTTNCGYPLIFPPDPNGGTLYIYNGCGNTSVFYGSYLVVPLQSTTNPGSFQIALYANPAQSAVRQFTVGGNRYITSTAIAPPDVQFNGQSGTSNVAFTSLIP